MTDAQNLKSRLYGAITALVTPFKSGGIDFGALETLVEWQVGEGINGLVICGTTGEAPTITLEERIAVTRRTVEIVAGRVPVIAGTGTNDTRATINLTLAAASAGVDAALVVTPYYTRPTQEGIFRHYQAVATSVDLPVLLYNVPLRTGVDLTLPTIRRLAGLEGVIGLKDASGDLSRPLGVTNLLGEDFLQFSGHDATSLGFCQAGGRGTISVVSNVMPRLCVQMHEACCNGDLKHARSINQDLGPLSDALELETSPAPVKYALSLSHAVSPEVRLPLVEVSPETASAIHHAMRPHTEKSRLSDVQNPGQVLTA